MSDDFVFVVDGFGIARAVAASVVQTEAWRISEVRALGVLPSGCSSEIRAAPARGPVKCFTPVKLYPKGDQDWELKPSGQLGPDGVPLKSILRTDVFDLMAHKARASHRGDNADFIPPFSPAQIMMGRHYRNLVERHASAGVQCSSVEAVGGGGSGGSSSFIDAVLQDRDQIARIQARIGVGFALEVKRKRRAAKCTGSIMGEMKQMPVTAERLSISVRRLVDMVCLSDKSLAEVLRAHGWAKRGGSVTVLQSALANALDRMMGPIWRQGSYTVHADGLSLGFEEFSRSVHKGA